MNKKERTSELKTIKGIGASVDNGKQGKIEKKHFKAGDINNKVCLCYDGGRTLIYCDPSREQQAREYWSMRLMSEHLNNNQ